MAGDPEQFTAGATPVTNAAAAEADTPGPDSARAFIKDLM